ncbi:Rpn family recombination-promoting nuclease/putative transposase [Paenibacillus thalictri]|uniref:Rpn family recombination-promoting nuclease/putative transposase n=1 Tax=Paenibacillus thalictri TaxID=2527873 RepID=A0A4Q9DNU1_9BACL|nr:Rpn family recombination-promoting nuclease/putative transposase [Paenibacillus thalictri]TBL75722.1 Rpn family recombination-promoting nuclease/putative transposase [Paenibacillus thalictri]
MSELLDPRNDFLFKRIFGSEENKDVLLAFLNTTFVETGAQPLTEIILLNTYTDKDAPHDKQSILDIRGKTADGELINVEMQLFNKYETEKRTMFYWSKLYSGQLQESQPYKALKKCVTINILNYSILPNEQYHNVFHLREDRTGIPLIDDLELHFLELPKLGDQAVPIEGGGLVNWLLFLKGVDKSHWEVLTMNEPVLKKAMNTLEFLSQDAETRRLYEARQKYLHDEASLIDGAMTEGRNRGLIEGRAEGLKEGKIEGRAEGLIEGKVAAKIEMARELLSLGIDIAAIAKASGLTEDEIRNLKTS